MRVVRRVQDVGTDRGLTTAGQADLLPRQPSGPVVRARPGLDGHGVDQVPRSARHRAACTPRAGRLPARTSAGTRLSRWRPTPRRSGGIAVASSSTRTSAPGVVDCGEPTCRSVRRDRDTAARRGRRRRPTGRPGLRRPAADSRARSASSVADGVDRVGQRTGVTDRRDERGAAGDLDEGRRVGADDRGAHSHGLGDGQAEALGSTRRDQRRRRPQHDAQVGVADLAQRADRSRPVTLGGRDEVDVAPARLAGDDERRCLRAEQAERLDQHVQTLAGLEGGQAQQEPVGQLQPPSGLGDVLGSGLDEQGGRDVRRRGRGRGRDRVRAARRAVRRATARVEHADHRARRYRALGHRTCHRAPCGSEGLADGSTAPHRGS